MILFNFILFLDHILKDFMALFYSPSYMGSKLITGRLVTEVLILKQQQFHLEGSPRAAAASHQPPSSTDTPSTWSSQPHCLGEYLQASHQQETVSRPYLTTWPSPGPGCLNLPLYT